MTDYLTQYITISILPTGDAFLEASLTRQEPSGMQPITEYIKFGMLVPNGGEIRTGDVWQLAARKFRDAAAAVGQIEESHSA